MLKKQNIKEIIRLFSIIKPKSLQFLIGLLGESIMGVSIYIAVGFVMKDMVDSAIHQNIKLLYRAIIVISLTGVIASIMLMVFSYMHKKYSKQAIAKLKLKVFKHLEELPVDYYEAHHSGEVMSTITNSMQAIEGAFSWQLYMVCFSLLFGIGSMIAMFALDWRFAILFIIIGFITSHINLKYAVPLRNVGNKLQDKLGNLTGKVIDLVSGMHIVKMFDLIGLLTKKYTEINDETAEAFKEQKKISSQLDSINFFLNWTTYVSTIVIGAFMLLNNSMEFGKLIAIGQMLNGVSFMFSRLGAFVGYLQASLAGSAKVFELLEQPIETQAAAEHNSKKGSSMLEVRNLSFKYIDGNNVLNNLSFSADEGKITALVGQSGGGKSTIFKLLLGFYKPQNGSLMINKKSIGEYDLFQLRDMIAYVSQDSYLFDGSIEENIKYGRYDATQEEIIAAAKAANAHDFITEMPDDYKTMVGERGVKLSGGQKQRIAIARAILKNSPILLLDEATSSLDTEAEQLVQQALSRLMEGRTVLVIAHRLSTIEHADKILVVEAGAIVEQGTHSELLKLGGIYNNLYEIQCEEGKKAVAS